MRLQIDAMQYIEQQRMIQNQKGAQKDIVSWLNNWFYVYAFYILSLVYHSVSHIIKEECSLSFIILLVGRVAAYEGAYGV